MLGKHEGKQKAASAPHPIHGARAKRRMSVRFTPKDIGTRSRDVCFVPKSGHRPLSGTNISANPSAMLDSSPPQILTKSVPHRGNCALNNGYSPLAGRCQKLKSLLAHFGVPN